MIGFNPGYLGVNGMHNWIAPWMKMVASEIGRSHGRDLVKRMTAAGKSVSFIKKIKNTVNVIYNFGI
jgi:integrase